MDLHVLLLVDPSLLRRRLDLREPDELEDFLRSSTRVSPVPVRMP